MLSLNWMSLNRDCTVHNNKNASVTTLAMLEAPLKRSVNFRMTFWCLKFSKKPTQKFDEKWLNQKDKGTLL